jgi:hypothetical protein
MIGVALTVLVLGGGCSADQHQPRPVVPSPSPSPDAKALLDTAVGGLTGNARLLGSGYGSLRRDISNTLAETPPGASSVSFVFVCTGPATVSLKIFISGTHEVKDAGGTYACNDQAFQRKIDVGKPKPVAFEAEVKGAIDGTFGYAYLK